MCTYTCHSPLDPSSLLSGGHARLFVVTGQGAQKGVPGTCPVAGMVEEVLEDKTEATADTGGHKGIKGINPKESSASPLWLFD